MNKITKQNLQTVIEAYDTNATLSTDVIYGAMTEVMYLYKVVRNTVIGHQLTNEQTWLNWETDFSQLTTEDPTIKSTF